MPCDQQDSKEKKDESIEIAKHRLELWKKTEEIAIHFNDLIIKLRLQALGGITVILALSGIAINSAVKPPTAEQWDIIFGTLLFLIVAWIAIAVLDLGYYRKLLLGAVESLLAIEVDSRSDPVPIRLSTCVENLVNNTSVAGDRWWKRAATAVQSGNAAVLGFYAIILISLLVAAVTTKSISNRIAATKDQSPKPLRVEIDRTNNDKLHLTIDPLAAPASGS